ncbi:MAG TPA: glycoside hydrolase family 20 zincin-like fold domain-containing protein [Herpetosiphonaceae bacterium]
MWSLLPAPRSLSDARSVNLLEPGRLIVLDAADPQALLPAAKLIQRALREHASLEWEISASPAVPAAQVGLLLKVAEGLAEHAQGYALHTGGAATIKASTAAGAWYGAQTLRQLIEQQGASLPVVTIQDWPDFEQRGVMIDISRDKVPSLETLCMLIDELAAWKINQVQLYTEHTFAYRQHPSVWAKASPLTGDDILALDAFCAERGIELVPNQNTFGHMRRWLNLPEYRELSEAPDGCDTIWGRFDEPFTLNPGDPASLELVRSLFDELLPHFRSRQVNVGCDETVDLGQGMSKEAVEQRGKGRVYLDFVLEIYREVSKRGRIMQFWGDIIVEYPELVPELPRDAIALEWGYEADHPFEKHGGLFAAAGIPFYVCPGTSAWNTVAGRTTNALENLRNAAANGLKHGATGYLITDWGDNGHWQPLPVSYLGFAYGAALGWCGEANREADVAGILDRHAFRDSAGVLGRVAYDLGEVYRRFEPLLHNNSTLFRILQLPAIEAAALEGLTAGRLEQAAADIRAAIEPLNQARPARPDAELLGREFRWAAELLLHACERGRWVLDGAPAAAKPELRAEIERLTAAYRELWLARNRPGGLEDSVERFDKLAAEYGE